MKKGLMLRTRIVVATRKKTPAKCRQFIFLLLKLDWDSQHQYYIKYIRSIHRQNGMLNFVKISRNRMTTVVLIALN